MMKETSPFANKLYFLVIKVILLFSFLFLEGCAIAYHKFKTKEIITEKKDSNGRLVSQKYKQWISDPAGNSLATITQEYDTLGRVIKEYGFNNQRYGRQYLLENFYKGNKRYILNEYNWTKLDSAAFFEDYKKAFKMQWIFQGTDLRRSDIIIKRWDSDSSKLVAMYNRQIPIADHSWTNDIYKFELAWEDMKFDNDGRLVLDKVKRLPL